MTVNETNKSSLFASQMQIKKADNPGSFASLLQGEIQNNSNQSSSNALSESDVTMEEFKEALNSKGALKFLQDYNQEKIEKMIEEKKAELKEKLGLGENAQPPLTGDERKTALATLDDMLDAFKKQLQEKLQAEKKLEQQANSLSTFLQGLS